MSVKLIDKPWLKSYDPEVPHTLEFPSHALQQFLTTSAEKYPDRIALVMKGYEITFKELDKLSDQIASALHATGFEKGNRAIIYMPNSPQFVIAAYGILKAGGIMIATNPLYTERELLHQLKDCQADTMFVSTLFYERFKAVQPKTNVKRVIATNIKEYFPTPLKILFSLLKEKKDGHRIDLHAEDIWFQDFLRLGAKNPPPKTPVSGDDIALIQYTGGTTGLSKGAIAPHKNLVANVHMLREWLHSAEFGKETFITTVPLFHSYGMIAAMHLSMYLGATQILIPNPRDQKDVLNSLQKYKVTVFPGVPAMYIAINHNKDMRAGKYDISSVKVCVSSSAPLLEDTKEKFEKLSGGVLVEGYGMTEAHVATHANPIGKGKAIAGSIGVPLPGVDSQIRDIHDSSIILDIGEIGELWIKSPTLMTGYWNLDQKTEEVLQDGWYATGDIVECDENGYFYIRDRKKDMILSGGYNIYPRELEEVYVAHPQIMEAAVIGVPHPTRGEEAVAYIVPEKGNTLTAEEFVEWGKEQFAKYKYPRKVVLMDELPKSGVGKILKRELRKIAEKSQ